VCRNKEYCKPYNLKFVLMTPSEQKNPLRLLISHSLIVFFSLHVLDMRRNLVCLFSHIEYKTHITKIFDVEYEASYFFFVCLYNTRCSSCKKEINAGFIFFFKPTVFSSVLLKTIHVQFHFILLFFQFKTTLNSDMPFRHLDLRRYQGAILRMGLFHALIVSLTLTAIPWSIEGRSRTVFPRKIILLCEVN
ncbi:hypothetical protein L9F63_007909, partial [Diploptera punctata]